MSFSKNNKASGDTMSTGKNQGDSMPGSTKSTKYFKKHTLLDKSRNNITDVVKKTSEILNGPDTEIEQKFNALQLIKENMETKNLQFATAIADADTLRLLEKNILDHENKVRSNPKSNTESAKKFYTLMLECIKVWGETYENEKEPLNHFPMKYKQLLSKGTKFPTSYIFFKTKPEADPKAGVKPLQLSSPSNSNKDLKGTQQKKPEEIKAAIEALRHRYEEILQQPFFYNAQEIELDDAPVQEQPQMPLPFLYNAQELELDDDSNEVIREDEREHETSMRNSAPKETGKNKVSTPTKPQVGSSPNHLKPAEENLIKRSPQHHAQALEDDDGITKITKDSVKANTFPNHRAQALEDDVAEEPKVNYEIKKREYRAKELEDDEEPPKIPLQMRRPEFRAQALEDDQEPKKLPTPSPKKKPEPAYDFDEEYKKTAAPPPENNIGPLLEKELNDLKKKNERLLDEKEDLKVKNAQLEVKLAKEAEKTKELKEQLEKKENDIKAARNKVQSLVSPKSVTSPLGSPKAEKFKKATHQTPKAEKLNKKDLDLHASHPPSSIGEYLRKKLETDDDIFPELNNPLTKSSPTMLVKNDYISPKKGNAVSNFLQSPKKAFQRHENLPFSTNLEDFQSACIKPKAVLFKNDHISIKSKTNFDESSGRTPNYLDVVLTYKNKTAQDLEDFAVTYKTPPKIQISADKSDINQIIPANKKQVHSLKAKMIGPTDAFGTLVVEYRINGTPYQYKLHFPVLLTKFLSFLPIPSADFSKKRKDLQAKYPQNYDDSPKIKVNQSHLPDLEKYLFSKMTSIQGEGINNSRFTLFGGWVKEEKTENETLLTLVQLNYSGQIQEYSRNLLKMIVFLCNGKI